MPVVSKWQLITCTYKASTGNLTTYTNGVQTAQTTGTPNKPLKIDAGALTIGSNASSQPFSGGLDEVRVANVELSADEVATEYANESSPWTFYSIGSWPNGNISLSTGIYPLLAPAFYNDQYDGSNSWPATGKLIQGDTFYTTWAPDGSIYFSWNDGYGTSSTGQFSEL